MVNELKQKIPEYMRLRVLLFVMGFLVVTFNVMGYDILFSAKPWFNFLPVSPFGVLLGCAEFAVLLWTSAVIKDWHKTSIILKILTFILVPAFSFLCYSGINSYLSSLATAEIRKVNEVKVRAANNDHYLQSRKDEIKGLENQLANIRKEQVNLNDKINIKNLQINKLSEKASERRLQVADCSKIQDCANSVAAFSDQANRIALDIANLNDLRQRNNNRISKLENQMDSVGDEIRQQRFNDRNSINQFAGVESEFKLKKASYERIMLTVAGWFGFTPQNPFGLFVSFLSFIIYPVYFMLNLFLALNSPENKAIREQARAEKLTRRELKIAAKKDREKLLQKVIRWHRVGLLRRRKKQFSRLRQRVRMKRRFLTLLSVLKERKSYRKDLYKKLIKYLQVWARRRTKIKEVLKRVEVEVEVEKRVEVEVEKVVEKIKEVPYEVKIEVPVQVDRVIEVPKEVPVYVDKVTTVKEPFIVKEPEIFVHERIVPVPENISADELEDLLNAQPRLN